MESVNTVVRSSYGGALSVTNGVVYITNTYNNTFVPVKYANIMNVKKTAAVAETADVDTVTVTRAASTEYRLTIVQKVGSADTLTPEYVSHTFYHMSSAGAASDQSIVDAFVTMINAHNAFKVTAAATAATTFTITTAAGYPVIRTTAVTSNLSVAQTTPAVVAKGQGADLIAAGIEDAVSGRAYTLYEYEFKEEPRAVGLGGLANTLVRKQYLWVDTGETDLIAQLDGLFTNPTTHDGSDSGTDPDFASELQAQI